MSHYPIMVKLLGKKVVVVGGGKIAERKVAALLDGGGMVTVISPEVTDQILQWSKEEKLTWLPKRIRKEMDSDCLAMIREAMVVVVATDVREINALVASLVGKGQLLNIVDDPDNSSFLVPSVLRRGRLTITVATEGASPKLAKKIKGELAGLYGAEYEGYTEFLYQARQMIVSNFVNLDLKGDLLEELLDEGFLYHEQKRTEFLLKIHQLIHSSIETR